MYFFQLYIGCMTLQVLSFVNSLFCRNKWFNPESLHPSIVRNNAKFCLLLLISLFAMESKLNRLKHRLNLLWLSPLFIENLSCEALLKFLPSIQLFFHIYFILWYIQVSVFSHTSVFCKASLFLVPSSN